MGILNILAGTISSSESLTQLGTATWLLSDIFRSLFFYLDSILYYLIPELYNLALKLADIRNILNQQEIVNNISTSLYTFFALAMFFRYAFALLIMIADPDKIEDKQKGLGKIVTNSIIAIVLTILMPTIFGIAYDVQSVLIGEPGTEKQGILYNIFTRMGSGNNTDIVAVDEGTRISKQVFNLFVEPILDGYAGTEGPQIEENWNLYKNSGVFNGVVLSQFIDDDKESKYAIAYLGPISTVAGVFLVWTLLTVVIEVGVRSLKLFALQIISPIAIISYIDPDSASKGIFKKWTDVCMKTYLSLFFRVFVLSFFVTIMTNVDMGKIASMSFWILLFFFISLMSFIVIAPKMFEEIFNYKSNDDAKLGKQLVSAATGGIIGAGIGAVATGAYAGYHGANPLTGMARGFGKGLTTGGKAGFSGKGAKLLSSGLAGGKAGISSLKGSKSFKEADEANKKMIEDGKSVRAFEEYDNIVKGYNDEDKITSDADFVSMLTSASAGTGAGAARASAALSTFGGLSNATDKKQFIKDYNFESMLSSMGANDALSTYSGLSSAADKKQFRSDFAKKQANDATYGKGSNVANAMNEQTDKEWDARMKKNELLNERNKVSRKHAEYDNAIRDRFSLKPKLDEAAANYNRIRSDRTANPAEKLDAYNKLMELDTAYKATTKIENDFKEMQNHASAIEMEYEEKQKAADRSAKRKEAVLDSPENKRESEKSKRIDRGKFIHG